jgi:general secretion pathway protein D
MKRLATIVLSMMLATGAALKAQEEESDFDPGTPMGGFEETTPNLSGGSAPAPGGEQKTLKQSDPKKPDMAFAKPEDITNENFPNEIESFDYPNAEITDVIKAISQLTGKNFIISPGVKGKITIIAPSKITVAEAYQAFLSALASLGYTIVPSGKFYKIKTGREARQDSIETYAGEYFPDSDQMITKIVKLKFISAAEVEKTFRPLATKDGEVKAYAPTNSVIITDYGSNVSRIVKIIDELDVPGFEEQLAVIAIKFAKAKDIADLINRIINKNDAGQNRFGGAVSRFRRQNDAEQAGNTESLSLVLPDDRTNSIIVVGNKAGVDRIRKLVSQLDFKLRPEDSGGVYVYYVKHGQAEDIAKTLSGVAQEAARQNQQQGGFNPIQPVAAPPIPGVGAGVEPLSSGAIFGGDVKVVADKATNSLVITASRQDYDVVKNLLRRIDIPRDQVFVKVIIMEMDAALGSKWGVDFYRFAPNAGGIGRAGFRTTDNLQSILSPVSDQGAILGFGSGADVTLTGLSGQGTVKVKELTGFVNFLKNNAGGNVLSTPQIMALNNEKANIEVGEQVPVSKRTATGQNGITETSVDIKDATINLTMTPFISPQSDRIRLSINQKIKDVSPRQQQGFQDVAVSLLTRNIETQIVVQDGDTAVLGGLMRDVETENTKKIPILGDIPLLGWLFKSNEVTKRKFNLVVFITPRIVRNADDQGDLLTKKLNERIDFIKRNMGGRDPHGSYADALTRRAKKGNVEEPAAESF